MFKVPEVSRGGSNNNKKQRLLERRKLRADTKQNQLRKNNSKRIAYTLFSHTYIHEQRTEKEKKNKRGKTTTSLICSMVA